MLYAFSAVAQDDVATLQEHLQLPDLPYVDFSREAEQQAVLDKWPLLRELYPRQVEQRS